MAVPSASNRSNLQEQTTTTTIYTPDGDFNVKVGMSIVRVLL